MSHPHAASSPGTLVPVGPARAAVPAVPDRPRAGLALRLGRRALSDAGMTSAEYAVGTVAACGFGGLLYKVLTSDATLSLLSQVISKAFEWIF